MSEQSKKLVIFTDIGDTIIDENTEERDSTHTVMRAACIPGAKETFLRLYREEFPIVMVADGGVQSFHNTMTQNGLDHIFRAKIISQAVGEDKPSAKMFRAAMDATMGLTDADKGRVIMIGNNVKRDILGANRFGIRSVLIDWSTRRPYDEAGPEEHATYRVHTPEELLPLAHRLENELES